MLYSHASHFSEMAQASPTKHSLSRCNNNLYDIHIQSRIVRVEGKHAGHKNTTTFKIAFISITLDS